jgi:hypothetical protein
MTFKVALEQTPDVNNRWCDGLQALRAEDRPHVQAENTRQLRGSADIDAALLKKEPNANRWDFGISYQHNDRKEEVIYWTEMHTASDSEVSVVIRKAQWLVNWLKNSAPKLNDLEQPSKKTNVAGRSAICRIKTPHQKQAWVSQSRLCSIRTLLYFGQRKWV